MDFSHETWASNIITGAVILGVMSYLFKRFVDINDKKHDGHEKEILEVQKNYNHKFTDVHKKLDQVKDELKEDIKEITRDAATVARDIGRLEVKVDNVIDYIKRKP